MENNHFSAEEARKITIEHLDIVDIILSNIYNNIKEKCEQGKRELDYDLYDEINKYDTVNSDNLITDIRLQLSSAKYSTRYITAPLHRRLIISW